MKLTFTTLDVFTSERFSGNALAVVRVPVAYREQLSEEQKQKIATEFNLSETVFLHEVGKDDTVADYDIFTALSRMTFAGRTSRPDAPPAPNPTISFQNRINNHIDPTIGTAIYVASHARPDFPAVTTLRTIAGLIPLTFNTGTGTGTVSIPADVHVHAARLPHPLPSPDTNSSDSATVPLVSIVKGMTFNLVPLATLPALASVSAGLISIPDLYKHEHLDKHDGWAVGFTGTFYYVDLGADPEDAGRRLLRTRSIGSREDPGTGSASGALCSYLALQEPKEKRRGPFEFHLVQGVEMGRRCDIFASVVRTEDGESVEGVKLTGRAVQIMEGIVTVE